MKMHMEATNVKSEASALVSSHPDSQSSHYKCKHCGRKNHRSDRCWKAFPELAPARFSRRRTCPTRHLRFSLTTMISIPVMTNYDFTCMMAKAREPDEEKKKKSSVDH